MTFDVINDNLEPAEVKNLMTHLTKKNRRTRGVSQLGILASMRDNSPWYALRRGGTWLMVATPHLPHV